MNRLAHYSSIATILATLMMVPGFVEYVRSAFGLGPPDKQALPEPPQRKPCPRPLQVLAGDRPQPELRVRDKDGVVHVLGSEAILWLDDSHDGSRIDVVDTTCRIVHSQLIRLPHDAVAKVNIGSCEPR